MSWFAPMTPRLSGQGTVSFGPVATGARAGSLGCGLCFGLVFAATQSESGYASDAMLTALLKSSDRDAVLLQFAGNLDARDVDLLRRALRSDGGDADRG